MLKITCLASRKSYLFIIGPNLHEKLSTKGKDLLFNDGIWQLDMAGLTLHWIDSLDMKLYRFHNLDSTFEVIQRLYMYLI